MSRGEVSIESGSGFDEALSHFLAGVHGGNLLESLRQKCVIGSAINLSFKGSDMDALTMAQSLSYLRATYMQKDELDLRPSSRGQRLSADFYCIFHQQLCKDWQSKEYAMDRSVPIFEVLPHRKVMIHLSDPKTNCLALLAVVFGLDNVLFVGLHNVQQSDGLPGPYLGLFHPGSRESFLKALHKMEAMTRARQFHGTPKRSVDESLDCDGRLAEISYLASEFDDLYECLLCDSDCYSNFTEPLLLNMYSNRLYGKVMLPIFMRAYRRTHRLTLLVFLKRLNCLLRLVCRLLNNLYNRRGSRVNESRNFGTMSVLTLIYSYLYGFLSIPVRFTPWNKAERNEYCTCKFHQKDESCPDSDLDPKPADQSPRAEVEKQSPLPVTPRQGFQNQLGAPSVGALGVNFASTAADVACVESTRRCDVLMCHAIGVLSEDGNWIRRSERYVDVIDSYKLSLCWYRRPLFSSCFATNYKVLYPWAIMYHQTNVAPCGSAWLEWQGRTTESWSSLPIWRNLPQKETVDPRNSDDCVRCLKRLVGLRIRDCVSFLLDIDLELKRSIIKNHCF